MALLDNNKMLTRPVAQRFQEFCWVTMATCWNLDVSEPINTVKSVASPVGCGPKWSHTFYGPDLHTIQK